MMAEERPLRLLTLATTALATPLLIACTVISIDKINYYWWSSRRNVTTFCFGYIPLAITTIASVGSLIHNRRHGRMPGSKYAPLDGLAVLAYMGVLIPIWAVEIGKLEQPGFGLLAGYTTAPMIVNLCVHLLLFVYNVSLVWKACRATGMHECPNCHSNFMAGAPKMQQTNESRGVTYSLLRGEEYLDGDQDAVVYVDGRDSEEDVRPEVPNKDDVKGKAVIDV
ncbi:hypothetical protein ACN47E_008882 [Coniothyrium glycines]